MAQNPATVKAMQATGVPVAYIPPVLQQDLLDRGAARLRTASPHADGLTTICYTGRWIYGDQSGMLAQLVEGFKRYRAVRGEQVRTPAWRARENSKRPTISRIWSAPAGSSRLVADGGLLPQDGRHHGGRPEEKGDKASTTWLVS